MNNEHPMQFHEAVRGLLAGDFSRLAPLFDGAPCPIIQWHEAGLFAGEPQALDEAFTNACFLGRTEVAEYFLAHGVDPSGGIATGLNAFHWTANRGHLAVVRLLLRHKAPLETRNSYGGTVLGGTVWAAVHETRPEHPLIIEALLRAGAEVREAEYPSGDARVDKILRRYRAGADSQVGNNPAPKRPFAP
jgi:hypothetical protein